MKLDFIISRHQSLIPSMVRPTLEYASASWDHYMTEDINRLEQVQRRAARFAHNNYHDRFAYNISKMIQDLN